MGHSYLGRETAEYHLDKSRLYGFRPFDDCHLLGYLEGLAYFSSFSPTIKISSISPKKD